MSGSRGATALELVAILLVLALGLAILLPLGMQLRDRAPLRAAARQVAAALRAAQQAAVTELVPWEVRFTPGAAAFKRRRAGVPHGPPVNLPEGIRVAEAAFSGDPWVAFGSNGAPSAGGCVALENPSGRQMAVEVAPVTGRVRVLDQGCPP